MRIISKVYKIYIFKEIWEASAIKINYILYQLIRGWISTTVNSNPNPRI